MKIRFVYRCWRADGQTMYDEMAMTFDTQYCEAGHPWSIMRDGIEFVTDPRSFDYIEKDKTYISDYIEEAKGD